MKIREMTILSSLTTVLVVQSIILSYIPYIQFTFLLMFVYSRVLGIKKSLIIITVYMVVINIVLGSVLVPQFITMFIGFSLIPILLNTIFKQTNNVFVLSLLALIISFIYIILLDFSWWLVYPSGLKGLFVMLVQGIIFAMPMLISSLFTVFLLFKPLEIRLSEIYNSNK